MPSVTGLPLLALRPSCLGCLYAVLVDVHVFVGLGKELAHRGRFIIITGKRIAHRVADRHVGVSLGILAHVRTNPSETGFHGSSIGMPQHRDKLIAAVAAHKAGLGRHAPQLLGKRTDVLVTLLVAKAVIDRMQIVKIEDAHRNGLRRKRDAPAPRFPRTCSCWAVPWLHRDRLCSAARD